MTHTTYTFEDTCVWNGSGCDGLDSIDYSQMTLRQRNIVANHDGWRYTTRDTREVATSPFEGRDILVVRWKGIPKRTIRLPEIREGTVVIVIGEFKEIIVPEAVFRLQEMPVPRDITLFIDGIKKASYVWGNVFVPYNTQENQMGRQNELAELVDSFLVLLGEEVKGFRETFGRGFTEYYKPRNDYYRLW
jgi:hypothetical protein